MNNEHGAVSGTATGAQSAQGVDTAGAPAGGKTSDAVLQNEVAALIVEALNLEIAATDIDPDEPLYGEGLGLDSIDVLEIALVVSKRYGFQLRADNDDNHRIFSSLRSLADYISTQRVT
jgi:acyl carrier protein